MTFTYFPNLPNGPDYPGDDQPGMQTNTGSISSLIAVDHIGFNVANGGTHKQVTYINPLGSDPGATGVVGVLYTKNVAGVAQLFFQNSAAVIALSAFTATISGNGSITFPGGVIMKWGTAIPGNGSGVSFSGAFPTACFGVQVTLNTSGTLVNVGINGFTTSGFTFRTSATGTVPITYFAIGN